jgi:hypothetical protein
MSFHVQACLIPDQKNARSLNEIKYTELNKMECWKTC